MSWALIMDGVVQEITDVDPADRFHKAFKWVPCGPEVKQRWTYDNNTFSPPQEPEPVPATQQPLSFSGFMDLFTDKEQTAIVDSTDPKVKLLLLMAASASSLSLDDARVSTGLDHFVSLGLLTTARKVAILNGQQPSAPTPMSSKRKRNAILQ